MVDSDAMGALADFISRHLQMDGADIRTDVSLHRGVRADLLIEAADATWLVAVTNQSPNRHTLGQLALYRNLLPTEPGRPVRLLMVAPAISEQTQELARRAGIETLLVPFELLPGGTPTGTPLTTERSWNIVYHILKHQKVGSIETLANATKVSVGWTHKVVQELATRGLVARSRGRIGLLNEEHLLDAITTERPLDSVAHETVATGHDDWDTLLSLLRTQLGPPPDAGSDWGLAATSAAAWWTGYETRHNRLDAYATQSDRFHGLFRNATGGIPLTLYRPDRRITFQALRDAPVAPLDVTLLDTLGLGYGQRDIALKVLERARQ